MIVLVCNLEKKNVNSKNEFSLVFKQKFTNFSNKIIFSINFFPINIFFYDFFFQLIIKVCTTCIWRAVYTSITHDAHTITVKNITLFTVHKKSVVKNIKFFTTHKKSTLKNIKLFMTHNLSR